MNARNIEHEVFVAAHGLSLPGTLAVPPGCVGVVVFAHGSGSSRLSARNVAVARALVDRDCGTLLFDLLTPEEASDRANVFDIDLLGKRVLGATTWLQTRDELRKLPIGFFGASTGAAAALVAAAELDEGVAAVVSRGGRPDLAADALGRVIAPTLLLVGSLDTQVLQLNRAAQQQLRCESKLTVIDNASHLFEEPGTLEKVAERAGTWFVERFAARAAASGATS
ncbi:MAG: dienelactone hydrolase family protein [Planctomycetota bacterium]|jgi:putative phosphoribosyl transferase